MGQAAVVLVVIFFAGVILLMLSTMGPCEPVTVYKYLPRDLDTLIREQPPVSVVEADVFQRDAWSDVTGHTDPSMSFAPLSTQAPPGGNAFYVTAAPS